jgi:protein-L-isoaspartate(D-aspartate) O-methyltransferase
MFTRLRETDINGIGMTSQRTRDRLVERLRDKGITDARVLEVLRYTPRHLFVDEALASRAYEDVSLPIGHSQTLSQPFVVARMTEAVVAGLARAGEGRVLELGTGSGYQAAVLAQLVPTVHTVERVGVLARRARRRFHELGLDNIELLHGDGQAGWPERAPFEAIVVTAAPQRVPQALFEQLAHGGCLVAPVGNSAGQQLMRYSRDEAGRMTREVLDGASFVPLLGGST